MRINPFHKTGDRVQVVIITASCCMPGTALFEQKTREVVERAASESGVPTDVRMMPATKAFFLPGPPRQAITQLMADASRGQVKVPVTLIDGRLVFCGVPQLDEVKTAILRAAAERKAKEEHVRG